SVAVDGDNVFAGAMADDELAVGAGAAHVFSLSGADCNGNGICDSRDIAEQGVGFGNGDAWAAFDPGDYGVGNDPDGYEGAVFDGRYIYFVPYHNGTDKHGEVLRYDTTGDFAGVTSWTTYDPGLHGVGADPDGYVGAAWDGRYVYFTPYHNGQAFHGEVLRYDTTGEFADVASWNAYDAGAHGLGEIGVGYSGALAYGSHVYFTPRRRAGSHHGEVLRYTLGEFADLASWSAYDPGQNGLGFDPRGYNGVVFDGRHVYFVPHFRDNVFHGEVLCYDTTGRFHELASWAAYDAGEAGVGTDPDGYVGGAFDGRYIYFAPHHNSDEYHGEVLRFDTTGGFDDVSAWSTYDPGFAGLGSDVDGYNGAVFDGRFVYFVPYHNGNDFHGEVLRYDTTGGFAALESWATFDPAGADVGDNPTGFDRAVFDGRYVYFVPFNHGVHHGEVLRYDTAASGAPDCNGNGIPDECDIAGGLSTDCNGNGVPDACDIAVGFSWDCNGNGVPDECDIASGSSADCNGNRVPDECELDCNDNGVPDDCDIESWFSADCNGNRIPDECDIATGNSLDCNTNGVPDECDIDTGMSADCNSNGVPDECDIATGISADCNSNSVPDECDTAGGFSADCNGNGVPDECDVQGGSSADCNSNGVPDECEPDCNGNGVADECDIDAGTSPDCNSNGVPDECDVVSGSSADCDGDEVPDECEVRLFEERSPQLGPLGAGYPQSHVVAAPPPAGLEVTITFEAVGDLGGLTEWVDVDLNGVPLGRVFASGASDCSTQPDAAALTISGEMFNRAVGTGDAMLRMVASSAVDPAYCPISFIVVTLTYHAVMPDDCNGNGTPDNCDIAAGTSDDLNGNGVPDECEVDCNGNGVPDAWDIATGASLDCNGNGVPDECDISAGASTDVNANAVPDECEPDCNGNSVPDDWDLLQGSSPDCNDNAVPDECDLVSGLSADCNGNSVPDECETGLKPVIAVQPQGQAACLGAPVSFAVVADGIAPLHYQWRQDGRPIPGATADTLAIDPVGLLDTGKYTVVVSNTCGSITSAAAVLVVDSPASITVQPLAASACDGHAHEFCVQATGVDLAYQWQHDGVPIPGANGPCFSATLPGSYACVVSNQCGALSSATVTLSLTPGGPLLESGPVDVAVCAGAEAVFAVTASGSGLLHYAWDMNGQVVGTDAATLRLTAVTAADDAAQFVCHVSDGCGTVSSAAATLIVAAPTTWYRDADGDGYGDAQISVLTCDQPAGYVVDGSDCDDANSNVFPGAAESCDGLDNDCDGDVDEEAPLWYRDADGDGLGDAEDVVQACTAPAGYVANADDLVDVVQTVPVETPSLPETPAPPAEQSQQDVPEASGDGGSPPCGLPVLVVMLLGLVGSRRWTRAADTWSKR
ncbi:MAG: hypothetical protein KKB50_20040, partial [Planctomycetes bacterium]|nr:hypothetical protein [Planctomycetota bacterium]